MRGAAVKMLRRNAGETTAAQWRAMKRNYARLSHTEKAYLRETDQMKAEAKRERDRIEATR
jgi:hypothetical protein